MKILAIETSGKVASAAIFSQGVLIAETLLNHTLTHSQILMPMIENLLFAAGLELEQMDAYAVTIGPGSFTGLRIGICTANAFAHVAQKPVIEVDSLEVLYRGVLGKTVCPLIDARNGKVYAALYEDGKRVLEPQAIQLTDLLIKLDYPTLFVGDGTSVYSEIVKNYPGASFAPAHLNIQRAGALAYAAAIKAEKEEFVREARPLYISKPQAERMLERKNG